MPIRRYRCFPTLLAPALLALAVLGAPAHAGEETPAARAAKVLASLPAPAADRGFRYEFALTWNDVVIGSVAYTAEAVLPGDAKRWRCTDVIEAAAHHLRDVELVDAQLAGIQGERVETEPTGTTHVTWERDPGGFNVTTTRGDGDPTRQRVSAPGFPSATGCSTILFLRAAPLEKATCEVRTFVPDGKDGTWVKPNRITIEGTVEWGVGPAARPAWVASVNDGEQTLRMAFDPASREFLGAQGVALPIAIMPRSMVPKPGTPVPSVDLSKPATDAKTAALKVGLAFAIGDRQMAESAIHWPSAFEAAMREAGQPSDPSGLEGFKQAALARVAGKASRATAEPEFLGSLEEVWTEDLAGGDVRVTLTPRVGGMTFHARAFDGEWLVVRFPSGG